MLFLLTSLTNLTHFLLILIEATKITCDPRIEVHSILYHGTLVHQNRA